MSVLSDWSSEVPSGTSLIRLGDDTFRSEKSVEYEAWEEAHYWDSGSADSGGEAKTNNRAAAAYSGPDSEVSVAGDVSRLMYNSTYSRLDYVGSDGYVPLGVPSPYRAYYQGYHPNTNDEFDETNRLPSDKVWVASVQSVAGLDAQTQSHFSWFPETQYGPYDGTPMVMASLASRPSAGVGAGDIYWDIRIPSLDSSGFSILLGVWDQGVDSAINDPNASVAVHILSLGTMDASRVS